jgi:hypothetical protein
MFWIIAGIVAALITSLLIVSVGIFLRRRRRPGPYDMREKNMAC